VLAELPGSVITIAATTGLPTAQVRRVLDKLHHRGALRYSLASGYYSVPGEDR
jgi:DNA-binding IclR family transcriptional regulator